MANHSNLCKLKKMNPFDQKIQKKIGFYGATLIVGEDFDEIASGFLVVDAGKIVDYGSLDKWDLVIKKYPDLIWIDANDFLIVPGLINSHTHTTMSFFRGLTHGKANMIEKYLFPVEENLRNEWVKSLSLPYFISGLKSGTTCFVDHYYFSTEVAKAAVDIGVRAVVGETLMDLSGPFVDLKAINKAKSIIEAWQFGSMVSPALAPHATNTCSPKLLKEVAGYANQNGLPIHLHLSQSEHEYTEVFSKYQKSPVELANECGILTEKTLAVHLVSAKGNDFKTLKNTGALAVICPSSQIIYEKLADIKTIIQENINFAIATDCAASNDGSDLLAETKIFALLAKHQGINDGVKIKNLLRSITLSPASALGLKDKLGSISFGKEADLVFIKKDTSNTPMNDPLVNLIYSSNPQSIKHVMIAGNWVVFDQKTCQIDEEQVVSEFLNLNQKIKALVFK